MKKEILKNDLIQAIIDLKYISIIAKHFNVSNWIISNRIKEYKLIFPRSYNMTEKSIESRKINGLKTKGDNNPSKRKDVRKKISDSKKEWWSKQTPEQRSIRANNRISTDTIKKCSKSKKEWWSKQTPEQLKLISEKCSKLQALIKNTSFSHHKSGFHTSFKGGYFYYRSSWELIIAELLDYSVIVSTYEYESETCEYYDYENDIYKHFRSDFIVTMESGVKILLEVKPSALINHNFIKLLGQWAWAFNNEILYKIITERLVKNINLFNQFLEDVNNGKYRPITHIECGLIES